jgi:NADH-quinone oxidoreductase subunit H
MKFGWKVLIPVSLFWIMVVSTLRVLSLRGASRMVVVAFASGIVLIVLLISLAFDSAKKKAESIPEEEVPVPAFAVPKLPGLEREEPRG